jgi:hypothetical protein
MFHTYVASVFSKVSSALDLCCIQVFHVTTVSCFRGMFIESWGHDPGTGGRGTVSRGPADRAHNALGVCGRGVLILIRAPGSRPRRERREGAGGRSGDHSQGARAG